MICRLHAEPCADRGHRLLRLQFASACLLGAAVLRVWNPATTPGPMCCGLRRVAGLPCPACGMTRGMSALLHGDPVAATLFNPLTVPAAVVLAALTVLWLTEFATARRIRLLWSPRVGRLLPWLIVLVTLANWAWLLLYRREDDFTQTLLGRLLAPWG